MNFYLQISLLILSVLAGGILVSVFNKQSNLKLLLSFSGGFLLTIVFVHVLPETYHEIGELTGYLILSGFLLQLLLEYFSKGAEHGHTHTHGNENIFPWVIFISLSIHAFIESMPLHSGAHEGHYHLDNFYWGIILHKIPVAVALKTILKSSGLSEIKSWVFMLIFALMAPAGLILGNWISGADWLNLTWILALAIGMLIHISTTIIFESSEGHKLNFMKFVAIIMGFGVGLAISFS